MVCISFDRMTFRNNLQVLLEFDMSMQFPRWLHMHRIASSHNRSILFFLIKKFFLMLRRQNASCFPMMVGNGLPLDPCQNWTYISLSVREICKKYRQISSRRLSPKYVVRQLLRMRHTSDAYEEYIDYHWSEIEDIVCTF